MYQPSALWGFDWVITEGLPPTYPTPDLLRVSLLCSATSSNRYHWLKPEVAAHRGGQLLIAHACAKDGVYLVCAYLRTG